MQPWDPVTPGESVFVFCHLAEKREEEVAAEEGTLYPLTPQI